MKKFSMGIILSSLLLIPVGCGEEATSGTTPPAKSSDAPAADAPAADAPKADAPAE